MGWHFEHTIDPEIASSLWYKSVNGEADDLIYDKSRPKWPRYALLLEPKGRKLGGNSYIVMREGYKVDYVEFTSKEDARSTWRVLKV